MRGIWVVVVMLAGNCVAQEKGSAEAYRVLADMQSRQMELEARWNVGKKLSPTLTERMEYPKKDNTLAVPSLDVGQVGTLTRTPFKVLDIVDGENCLLSVSRYVVWLKFPTDNLTDEEEVYLVGHLKVTGTRTYETAIGGSRKVHVLEFLPKDEVAKIRKQEEAAALEAEYPAWTSKAGTKINARFVKYLNGVVLEKPDGSKITVKLTDFAETDQDRLKSLIKDARKK